MFTKRSTLASLAVLAALVSPAFGQAPPPGVKVGTLGCTMSPTIGLLVGSFQTVNCRFTPNGPFPPEVYSGTIGTLGLDIGVTAGGLLAWGVFMQTMGPPNGALAGTYVGASGDIGVGVGVGANILFGGSNRSIALQPVSLEGSVSLDVTLGVSTLELRWIP